jgi:glyoxylase-like metal-dependent hydrolase (beta-lactamase superfamily II)
MERMNRRHATPLHAALLLAVLAFGQIPQHTDAAPVRQVGVQAPGFYRMRLGRFEVTALLDGTHPFPIPSVMVRARPDGIPEPLVQARPGEAEALLAEQHLTMPYEGSINAFLINTGTRLVLIDSGAGALYGACCGRLVANMRAAGYQPEQVDDVLLTHLHADHVGGVAIGGKMTFPNATIRMSRKDADYWLNPANEAGAPAILLPMFKGAQAVLKPYAAAKRLRPFDRDGDILPGFTAMATPGHTPGHTSYRVVSGGETLLVWGDIVHVSPIQFPDPHVTVTYDSDRDGAEVQRRAVFSEAAQGGFWIGAAHIAFPGLGHIGTKDGHFTWIPASYTTQTIPPE